MKILHHSDLDGMCAAAIVLQKYPDAECIEIDHGRPIPFDRIQPGEPVWIVDFSFDNPDDWRRLWQITKNVTWIDHHASAIKKADELILAVVNDQIVTPFTFPGIRANTACGAKLAWQYINKSEPVSHVVDIVDQWDRWIHNGNPDVINFEAGSAVYGLRATNPLWTTMLRNGVLGDATIREIQLAGEIIAKYRGVQDAKAVKQFAFPIEWEGYNCIVLYTDQGHVSKLFDSIRNQYAVLIAINFDGHQYTVHLRSDSVTVNNIAMKYGGNGHPGAAGFVCKQLPWAQGGAA